MNRFPIKDKYRYIELLRKTTSEINEVYIKNCDIIDNSAFYDLGVTDVKILEISKKCEFLITDDSKLSEYAQAFGIEVVELKAIKNESFR